MTRTWLSLIEASDLFESVVKNRAFRDTSIILFLNKKDIFVDKVMYLDIGAMAHFSNYDSSLEDFDEGVLYFI